MNDKLLSYAKMIILNHEDEYEEVKRRIDAKMLQRFRTGSDDMKRAVSALMNADDIFMSELRGIIAEAEAEVEVNE